MLTKIKNWFNPKAPYIGAIYILRNSEPNNPFVEKNVLVVVKSTYAGWVYYQQLAPEITNSMSNRIFDHHFVYYKFQNVSPQEIYGGNK